MICKAKRVVTYFTAIVVVVILLLVCYNVIVISPSYQLSVVHLDIVNGKHGVVDKSVGFDDSQRKPNFVQVVKLRSEDFEKPNFVKDHLALIPNFTHSNDHLLLKRSPFSQQSVKINHNVLLASRDSNKDCRDVICSEYLSENDLTRFMSCDHLVRDANATPYSGKCHFINGEGRDPVALVSFPGSGNTWVRGLLEAVTGVCTGAVYCDISLRVNGFAGEFIRTGSTLVVKTHENNPSWVGAKFPRQLSENHGRYGSAIFMVRNPFRALVAEWNRRVANNFNIRTIHLDTHIKTVGQEWFGENEQWDKFVQEQAQRWLTMIKNWIYRNRGKHPILLVKYETLKRDTVPEVKRILDFLGLDYTTEELQKRIDKGFSMFHRNHKNVTFDHFTSRQEAWVNSGIVNASMLLDDIDLNEYISMR